MREFIVSIMFFVEFSFSIRDFFFCKSEFIFFGFNVWSFLMVIYLLIIWRKEVYKDVIFSIKYLKDEKNWLVLCF